MPVVEFFKKLLPNLPSRYIGCLPRWIRPYANYLRIASLKTLLRMDLSGLLMWFASSIRDDFRFRVARWRLEKEKR